jgi:hypothetical protein
MYIRTCSLRYDGTQPESDEIKYVIDRTNKTLGNPYILRNKYNILERRNVIALYKEKLDRDCEQKGPMYQELLKIIEQLKEGHDIALMCWCAPLPCHGDCIIEKIKEIAPEYFGSISYSN